MTQYDFSDLQLTGEIKNLQGTVRFLTCFICVVTYRTGADRRLYTIISTDDRPATVQLILHIFYKSSRAMMYTLLSTFAIIPS